ncbi:MAG: hypothetical protein HY554_00160 [Elusimicrobia bacterium]|nr:hypothetical protein [Elusimicrobiota bacterium]
MTRSRLLLLCALALAACGPRVLVKNRPQTGKRPRVAVLPFKDAPGSPGTGELAREAFASEILAVDQYEVIDRSALDKIVEEQKLAMSGAVDPAQAMQLGKLLGADGVIVGAVTEFQRRKLLMFPPAKVAVTARMINTKTGVVDWATQHSVGGAKRWLTWVLWPVGALATATSPSAEDQVQSTARSVCKKLRRELASSAVPGPR